MRALVALALATVLLLASNTSESHGYRYGYGGGYYGPRVGVYVGSPWYWGPSWYWGAPFYWGSSWAWGAPSYTGGYPYGWGYPGWRYDAAGGYPSAPVYTERDVPPVASAPSGSWYYCADPQGYYPHVSLCNRPWVEVAPFAVPRDTPQPATSR